MSKLLRSCRWGYIVFLLAFVTAVTINIGLELLESRDPPCLEGVNAIHFVNLSSYSLYIMGPFGFLFLYCKSPVKVLAMAYWGYMALCFCFSLCGLFYGLTWVINDQKVKMNSMVGYSKSVFLHTNKIAAELRFTENKTNCCGIVDFMDYPLEIFSDVRIPDHCCKNYSKGCGKYLFQFTPLAYARSPTVLNLRPPSSCHFKSAMVENQISMIAYFNTSITSEMHQQLSTEFIVNDITKTVLCDNLDLNNYKELQCVTAAGDENTQIITSKLRWCFSIYYNDTPREFGKQINQKLNLAIPNGCFDYLNKFSGEIMKWIILYFCMMTILTCAILVIFLHYYQGYRLEQLTIYPLPLWLVRLPDEPEENLPRGLGRRCHVNNALSLMTEAEAKSYLKRLSNVKKQSKTENNESIDRPPSESSVKTKSKQQKSKLEID